MFKTVTIAPGTAAPVVSLTMPLMSPEFVLCETANPVSPLNNSISRKITNPFNFTASPPRKKSLHNLLPHAGLLNR
jgi:hypothetical protein